MRALKLKLKKTKKTKKIKGNKQWHWKYILYNLISGHNGDSKDLFL